MGTPANELFCSVMSRIKQWSSVNKLTEVKKHAESEPTIIMMKAEIHEMCATFLYFLYCVLRMQETLTIERIRLITLKE